MEETLKKLKDILKKKKILGGQIFPDLDKFKVFHGSEQELEQKFLLSLYSPRLAETSEYGQKNINKYKNRIVIAYGIMIQLSADKNWAVAVKIIAHRLTDEAKFGKHDDDSWNFGVKYFKSDLEKKPFKMDSVFQLSKLVANELMPKGAIDGVSYTRFLEILKEVKQKLKKNKNFKYE